MKVTTTAAALGATGAIALGAVAVPALAQGAGDDTATEQGSPDATEGFAPEKQDRTQRRRQALTEALAAELDLPVEEVGAALDSVHERLREERRERRLSALEERLDAAVAADELNREQADAILEAAEEGVLGGRLGRRGGPGHLRGAPGQFRGPGPSGDAPALEGAAFDGV